MNTSFVAKEKVWQSNILCIKSQKYTKLFQVFYIKLNLAYSTIAKHPHFISPKKKIFVDYKPNGT